MSDDKTAGFIAVEKIARNLATNLARLDEEANHYSSAALKLEETVQSTRDLTSTVKAVGDHAAEALQIISSTGGPEILKQLSSLGAQSSEQSTAQMIKLTNLDEAILTISSVNVPEIVRLLSALEAQCLEQSTAQMIKLKHLGTLTGGAVVLSFMAVAIAVAKYVGV